MCACNFREFQALVCNAVFRKGSEKRGGALYNKREKYRIADVAFVGRVVAILSLCMYITNYSSDKGSHK